MIFLIEVLCQKLLKILKKQEWNGNIRELKNFVESILVLEKGQRISPDMVKIHLNISKSKKEKYITPSFIISFQ